ncbi:leukocyte receptor cluster member 8 [Galendromus occidentalis]|uniref:Leukocyte receptor cluster member 8 n=1 Tax=Galendromus occidentalis TaxID=34638 RepID=A0AAJ7L4P1_9ACAR|nr:leukocyte receptor cluster member 8 [Galendromus occidentalis]
MLYYGTGYESYATPPPAPWGWGVGPRQKNARPRAAAAIPPPQHYTPANHQTTAAPEIPKRPTNGLGKAQYGSQTKGSPISKQSLPQQKGAIGSSAKNLADADSTPGRQSKNALDETTWPPKLKEYAARAFSKCKSRFDKNQVEIILKGKITAAIETDRLWSINWDEEALPTVYSETLEKAKREAEERQQKLKREREEFLKEKEREKNRRSLSSYAAETSSDDTSNGNRAIDGRHDFRKSSDLQTVSSVVRNAKSNRKDSDKKSNEKHQNDFLSLSTPSHKQRKSVIDRLSFTKGGKVVDDDDSGSGRDKDSKGPTSLKKKKFSRKILDDESDCDPSVLQKRARRFGGEQSVKVRKTDMSMNSTLFADNSYEDWQQNAIEGTCTDIEKAYFRLTSAPDASTVRPVHILRKSLEMIKKHWITKQDYHYACDQLKSLRQDLTVQCVRTLFTIEVYETHARIALEKGDHEEFNQCQTQLMSLYAEFPEAEHRSEFIGYKLLYQVFTENVTDINDTVTTLTSVERKDPVISHAVRVISAWNTRNFNRLFKLFRSAPRMSPYVMEWCLDKERIAAYKALVKAFRPDLPLDFVQDSLCFDGIEELKDFLGDQNAIVRGNVLDCKASFAQMS